jgi:hypothetical protein
MLKPLLEIRNATNIVVKCFLFRRSQVKLSAQKPTIVSEDICDYPQTQDNTLNWATTASFYAVFNSSFTYHPFI